MVERLLSAVRVAGLRPEGVDLSAFALIRSLYRADPEQTGRVLDLNVDGLTNLAIAEGTICRFTRVVGSGFRGHGRGARRAPRHRADRGPRAARGRRPDGAPRARRRRSPRPEPRRRLEQAVAHEAPEVQEAPDLSAPEEPIRPRSSCRPQRSRSRTRRAAGADELRRDGGAMNHDVPGAARGAEPAAPGPPPRRVRDGARERHPRNHRRGAQLARLPPLPGGRRRRLPRRPQWRGAGYSGLCRGTAGGCSASRSSASRSSSDERALAASPHASPRGRRGPRGQEAPQ